MFHERALHSPGSVTARLCAVIRGDGRGSSRVRTGVLLLVIGVVAALALWSYRRIAVRAQPVAAALTRLPYRLFVPRLAGDAAYRPASAHPPLARDSSPAALRLRAAAEKVLSSWRRARSNGDRSIDQHEVAIARLVVGDDEGAAASLRQVANRDADAAAWNDRAAALLVRCEALDDPRFALDALAATDHALALEPSSAAVSFNRALALEDLGLLRDARREWRRCLLLERNTSWQDEALQHLSRLPARNESEEWRRIFAQLMKNGVGQTEASWRRIVGRYPQYARRWGEGLLVAEWADATLRGDSAAAVARLKLARSIGHALQATIGDSLLADIVASIDRAASAGTALPLARAIALYRDGRLAHRDQKTVEAERDFRAAVPLLEENGNPMALLARYYLGSALHSQMRIDEAADVLDALLAEQPVRRGYRAFAPQIGWERGACFLDRGAYSDALKTFDDSRRELEAAGDPATASTMDAFLAVVLELVGDGRSAWRSRRRALAQFARSGDVALTTICLDSAAMAASSSGEWDRAGALLGIAVDNAERQNSMTDAHVYTQRAVVNFERHQLADAAADIRRARSLISRARNPRMRARAEADLAYAEAMTLRDREPFAAVSRFSASLAYYEQVENAVEPPRIRLERARASVRLGRIDDARRDLDDALRIIASQRQQLRDVTRRATLLEMNEAIFEEALRLAAAQRDDAGAFRLVEEQRGRALTEMFLSGGNSAGPALEPLPLAAIRGSLAPDAAIVEYASLPDALLAFVVRRESFSMTRIEVPRARLAAAVKTLRAACADASEPRLLLDAASAADATLLAPFRAALSDVRHLVVVADPRLAGVPFSALYDPVTGRFLIEQAAISTAPSATFAVRSGERIGRTAPRSVLAVAGTLFDSEHYPSMEALPRAGEEARRIAALYRAAKVLDGASATRASVLAALDRGYEVVHFASHAVANENGVFEPALLVAPAARDHGELRLSDLTHIRLPRTAVVVLAACGSGSTRSRQRDGASNLALGFIAAGVPTVIASMWDVKDAWSTRWMVSLQGELARGADPAAAVRTATLTHLRDSRGAVVLPAGWANIATVGGSVMTIEKRREPK
jgi:CHAT domain-containing protein